MSFSAFWLRKVISQEPLGMEEIHQVDQQLFLVHSILPSDNDIHVSTKGSPSPIGPAHLSFIDIRLPFQFVNAFIHKLEHPAHLFPRNFLLEVLHILQTYFLVPCQALGLSLKIFKGLYTVSEKLIGLGRADPPHS